VYADEAKTTEWAREIVSATEMHVKIPSLTSSTEIFVDWDGVRSDYAVGATYGRNNVWTDYEAVYHMNEASGDRYDSTGNGNTLTDRNTVGSAVGVMGTAADFEASNSEYLDATDAADISSQATISAWLKKESSTLGYIVQKGISDLSHNYRIEIGASSGGGFYRKVGSNMRNLTHSFSWSNNTNYLIHCVQDGNGGEIYINASSIVTDNNGGNLTANNDLLTVGARTTDAGIRNHIDGLIEELRMRKSAITSDWVTTEHSNQDDEATFWGTWTDAGGGGGGAAQTARRGVVMMM